MKKRVAILMGGDSSERVISLKSADVVYQSLKDSAYLAYKVDVKADKWFAEVDNERVEIDKTNFSLRGEKFDFAFMAIHGKPGEDGLLQAYLEMLSIPHTTCNTFEAALTFNKARCNILLRSWGIKVADSILIQDEFNSRQIVESLGLPLFVKPNRAGSSFGVSMVKNENDLESAISSAKEHDSEVLVEAFLKGREFGCGVHDLNGSIETFPITEIISSKDFFDYEAKYQGASKEITPAEISEEEAAEISSVSKKVYKLLNLKGVCRIDYKLDQGKASLIEVNTVPGLSKESIIPQMAACYGWDTKTLFTKMLENAR